MRYDEPRLVWTDSERGGKGACVKLVKGGEEGERKTERAVVMFHRNTPQCIHRRVSI